MASVDLWRKRFIHSREETTKKKWHGFCCIILFFFSMPKLRGEKQSIKRHREQRPKCSERRRAWKPGAYACACACECVCARTSVLVFGMNGNWMQPQSRLGKNQPGDEKTLKHTHNQASYNDARPSAAKVHNNVTKVANRCGFVFRAYRLHWPLLNVVSETEWWDPFGATSKGKLFTIHLPSIQ